uniref:Uncharacterized protein n=1 Tax=Solanum tuberosum TaxID=4113 RepID=M1D9J8_SOLTU
MEKGKSIDVELTEEDLRMELQRLRQEIQETREKRIEVEIATAVARAANTALDEDLATKMARYAIMNKETVAMRKEHDVFNNDITMRLQKIREKCSFFNQEANNGPEDTHPGATEEDTDEEIIYMPLFLGRLKGGDKKITLPAYEPTHSVGVRVVSYALSYEHLKASRMFKPLEGTTFGFVFESSQKMCAYHPNQRGHTIEECVELKAAIRNLINVGEIPYMWGENTILTCDQTETNMPVTEHTLFYCHYFTPFKKTLLEIYS